MSNSGRSMEVYARPGFDSTNVRTAGLSSGAAAKATAAAACAATMPSVLRMKSALACTSHDASPECTGK